jgi:hypothetical protein
MSGRIASPSPIDLLIIDHQSHAPKRPFSTKDKLMRSLPLVLLLLLTVASTTQGALLRIDITYTNGQILSGPLSADLTELPESVLASFTLIGTTEGTHNLADVVDASLAFGDGVWSLGDLNDFTTTLVFDVVFAVSSLTYDYSPINTSAVSDRIAGNFPLDIQGIDVASGEAFHYHYDTSSQSVTIVPEPSTYVTAAMGIVAVLFARRRTALGKSRAIAVV